jgi:hypothetical protein
MFVRCPQCGLPAEITDRFTLTGTSGPVEHVRTVCVGGRWFTPLVDDVEELVMPRLRCWSTMWRSVDGPPGRVRHGRELVPALQRLRLVAEGAVGALHPLRRERGSSGRPRAASRGPRRRALRAPLGAGGGSS